MTASPATRPSTSHNRRARAHRGTARALVALLAALLLAACLFVQACGGADSQGTDTQTGETTSATVANDPETLSNAVIEVWSQSMQALVTLLEAKPEVSAVKAEVQTLKEAAIQSLVALGRQRETFSDADRARVDSLEWVALEDLAGETWYTSYNSLWSYYSGADLEFGNLIAGFNTLTQYSDFGLLKQQLPEEAARLGVE
jgi:hypothetical protein